MISTIVMHHEDKIVVTIKKNDQTFRRVELIKGNEYMVNPLSSRVKKNRGRKVVFLDSQSDKYGVYAKVKYLDTRRAGRVETADLDYLLTSESCNIKG